MRNRPIRAFFFLATSFVLTSAAVTASAQTVCDNSCSSAFDGECDDGGPNSLYSICTLGSDCNDCGPRQAIAATTCTNTCSTAFDNECDDGGPGSMYSICTYGSDCNDCGPRPNGGQPAYVPPQQPVGTTTTVTTSMCENTCSTAFDNECDDGGPGSMYSICALGSDCSDCGVRQTSTTVQGAQGAQNAPGMICSNTCGTAFDNECDDGGPGSLYSVCRYGSDCGDCGARPPTAGCSNTCASSNDNECDDGGPGSMYSICSLGSDCSDCGPR